MRPFSGQGGSPYRRYAASCCEPASAFPSIFSWEGSSRSGEMPEPTVKVRMKENARAGPLRIGGVGAHVIALGDVSVTGKEIAVKHTRSAFADANCHAESVSRLPI